MDVGTATNGRTLYPTGAFLGLGWAISPGGGVGHSGTEWLPTAKRQREAEAVNAKI